MNSQKYFDTIASDWNQMRTQYFKDDIMPRMRETVSFDGKVVVDLGSGTGYIALEAAKTAKHVYALDQSRGMLERIDAYKKSNITTLKTEIIPEIFQTDSVDVVIINMALHHVQDLEGLFAEVHRILKPHGTFVISDVMKHEGSWAHEEMHDVWLGFELSDIGSLYERAAFKVDVLVDTELRARAQSQSGEMIDTHILLAKGTKGDRL